MRSLFNIFFDLLPIFVSFALVSESAAMLRRKHKICCAKKCIGTRGEYFYFYIRIRNRNSSSAPSLFPIQSSWRLIVAAGQSRPFRSASNRSA